MSHNHLNFSDISSIVDQKFRINNSKIEVTTDDLFCNNFSDFMVLLGHNFNGINLKILQIVDLIVGYNLWKFRINSLKIEADSADPSVWVKSRTSTIIIL